MSTNAAADLLRAEPRAVALLAASARAPWQSLLRHMRDSGGDACPAELLHALLAVDTLEGWLRRSFQAFQGLNPDDGMESDYHFREWFAAGRSPDGDRETLYSF